MKDFGSDKKALSFDEYDAEAPKLGQGSTNADIQYLLSYITLDQSQKLNLTQQSLKQQTNQQSITTQTLCNYITLNSNPETSSPTQRQLLVSIIDSGIYLISGIKKLMQKRKLDQQKNKSSMSSLDMFKELFLGRQMALEASEYGGQEFGKRKQTDVLMEQLRVKTQSDMLLARVFQNEESNGNGDKVMKHQFLLIKSLKEKLEKQGKQGSKSQQIQGRIRELDQLLNSVSEYREKNGSSYAQSQEYKKKLTTTWTLIDTISGQL